MEQELLRADNNYEDLDRCFKEQKVKKILLVCGGSFRLLKICPYFETLEKRLGIQVVKFSHFQPNPDYHSVVEGVEVFHKNNCDAIVAVGGGSAMDVAKCIKLYSNMESGRSYLEQEIVPNTVYLAAVPTTAGTGSEATRFAVIYDRGEKQSVADESCIPRAVLMDASALVTLPVYQKKASFMDAFCHAMEAFWSVNSTEKSKEYSKKAIRLILEYRESYLENKENGNKAMLKAANLAGHAINIAQTTAGHAMCYKLTSLYGIAHGHAAGLCVAELLPYMLAHEEKCVEPRGVQYIKSMFQELAESMGCGKAKDMVCLFKNILEELELWKPVGSREDRELLVTSVNPVRLKNNPISLDETDLRNLYQKIINQQEEIRV